MLKSYTVSFIHRNILQKLGQFLPHNSKVHMSKTTFENERNNHLIIQNCTTHTDSVRWRFSTDHTWELCVLLTPVTELHFVSKQGIMMQSATATETAGEFQPMSKINRFETLHTLHVWVRALCMLCSPYSRLRNNRASCSSRNVLQTRRTQFRLELHDSQNAAGSYGMNCITVSKTVHIRHSHTDSAAENVNVILKVE